MGIQNLNAKASRANAIKRTAVARNQMIRIGADVVTVGAACDRLGCTIQSLRREMKQRPTWAELERRFAR